MPPSTHARTHAPELHGQVQHLPAAVQPAAEEHVELRLPERRGQLVLHHLHPGARPDVLPVRTELLPPTDLQPHLPPASKWGWLICFRGKHKQT